MSNSRRDYYVKAVELAWQNNTPLSKIHEDFYFSLKNGLEETRYVYLAHNKLPKRWLDPVPSLQSPFTIVETGFGTGLNFLTAWQAWATLPEPKRPFSFISIEKHPLTIQDLKKSLANWPELSSYSSELIKQYPYLVQGSHLLNFDNGKVKLQLIFGDVNSELEKYNFMADCWFLDGFSPSKNPSMWTDYLFNLMASKSHARTTFSTFSAASLVRKGLIRVGFEVLKAQGFGGKRDMLYGKFIPPSSHKESSRYNHMWAFSYLDTSEQPSNIENLKQKDKYDAIIIGAGLAGITTAASLAEKGLKVAIIDQKEHPVRGASGQSQLALYVKLPVEINKTSEFISHCIYYSQRYLEQKQSNNTDQKFWHKTGLLQLAWNTKEKERHEKLIQLEHYPSAFVNSVDSSDASRISGLNIDCEGLWFENSGWLEPQKFAAALLNNPLISLITDTKVNNINWNETEKYWTTNADKKTDKKNIINKLSYQSKYLIIANSNDAKHFEQAQHLPSKPLKGQVSSIHSTSLLASNTVICGEGYLCPPVNNWHHFGATFSLNNIDQKVDPADNLKNITSIQKWLPSWLPKNTDEKELTKANRLSANTGLRCTTPDYMPIVGRVPEYDAMLESFAPLRKDAKSCNNQHGKYYPNLFINIGHGSKGLVTTPISAELISALITGGPHPFNTSQFATIAPARFIMRRLKQGKI